MLVFAVWQVHFDCLVKLLYPFYFSIFTLIHNNRTLRLTFEKPEDPPGCQSAKPLFFIYYRYCKLITTYQVITVMNLVVRLIYYPTHVILKVCNWCIKMKGSAKCLTTYVFTQYIPRTWMYETSYTTIYVSKMEIYPCIYTCVYTGV